MKIEIITPIMLAMFILNISANVTFAIPKSSTSGEFADSPNSWPYDSHHRKSTPDVSCPIKPPITSPAKMNSMHIHVF